MKNLKLILLLQALMLGALTLNAEDCPCEGGTADYSVDCDGDGTNDACSTDDCAACEAGNPASTGMECCDDEEFDPNWKGIGVTQSFSADPALVGKINNAVNLIPGVNITLTSAKGSVSGDKKDCCESDELQADGIGYAEGSLTVSGALKDLTIFGPPTISKKYDFTVVEVDIDFNVGAKLSSDLSVGGIGGSRWDNCGGDSCNYGSFSVSVSPSVAVTLEIIACVETWFSSKKCVDIEATPATISVSLSGSITSGDKDTCLGSVSGDVNLSGIQYSATFRVAEYEVSYTKDIYPAS